RDCERFPNRVARYPSNPRRRAGSVPDREILRSERLFRQSGECEIFLFHRSRPVRLNSATYRESRHHALALRLFGRAKPAAQIVQLRRAVCLHLENFQCRETARAHPSPNGGRAPALPGLATESKSSKGK